MAILREQIHSVSHRWPRSDSATKDHLAVIVTSGLYWSMLEAGLAIIACCLPTLQALFTTSYSRYLIASVRSAISLRSVHLHSSYKSKKLRQRRYPWLEIESDGNGDESTMALTEPLVSRPKCAHVSPNAPQCDDMA